MKYQAIFFDLDGTLLPLEMETFVKGYLGGIAKKAYDAGYDGKKIIDALWVGTGAMISNDGTKTNHDVFFDTFYPLIGGEDERLYALFLDFYAHEFTDVMQKVTHPSPLAAQIVHGLKEKGYRLALATNPVFPQIATIKRAELAGLSLNDFEVITTYEDCRYCKPSAGYYQYILDKMDVDPKACLMVGNCLKDDAGAAKLGFDVYMITDCLDHPESGNLDDYPHGSLTDFLNLSQKNL